MTTRPLRLLCALAALLGAGGAARAATLPYPVPTSSSPVLPARAAAAPALDGIGAGPADLPLTLALAEMPGVLELNGVHYQPRRHGRFRRQPESSGVSQVHAGFFDPSGSQRSRFDIGIRGGPMLDESVQLGLGVDWIHKGENISTVPVSREGPGGVPIDQ